MNKQDFINQLLTAFDNNGMSDIINAQKAEQFYLLSEKMLAENEKYNLTAITEPEKIILNHYLDCATLALRISSGARVIDIGCGAGFPTLPLAILRDDIHITAVDSTFKRVNYVSECKEMLSLNNVEALCMRAEDGAKLEKYRERYDVVTARAVAKLQTLSELCLPYVRLGGTFIAMKGKNAETELAEAKRCISLVGGGNIKTEKISLAFANEELTHPLIFIEKVQKTKDIYPRAYAQILKKPL